MDLESFPSIGISAVYKPFLSISHDNPLVLQASEDDDAAVLEEIPELQAEDTEEYIEENDGVPYINKNKINNESDELNGDYKKLVDSVIR